MDRGDQMAASYYMQRGLPGSGNPHELHNSPGSVNPHELHNSPPGIRQLSNPPNLPFQSNIGGGGTIGSTMPLDSSGISSQCVNVSGPSGAATGEPIKRKRGRPRKYGPDGTVSLTLTPTPVAVSSHPGALTQGQKRGRGRPPGSGKKQQLASPGGWLSGSTGMGFTPHVITAAIGEDIATKIMSFAQQGPRGICILSANGAVSTVTLSQPSTSGGSVTYEGRFEILCLAGSYSLTDNSGSRNRTGGLSVTLASPDGRVIGGGVGGLLIAASSVQVIIGSFMLGGSKTKMKKKNEDSEVNIEQDHGAAVDNPVALNSIPPNQNLTQASSLSPWSASRPLDMRNSHIDIDLMRE